MFAILIAFLAPLAYATSNVIDSHVSNHIFRRLSTILFYNNITNMLGIPFLFLFGMPQAFELKILPALLAVSAITICYQIPYYKALKSIDTSIISALLALGKVVIPVLAFFLLGEKLFPLQYVGFFVIIYFSLALNTKKAKKIKINMAFYYMLFVSLALAVQMVLFKYILNHLDWVSTSFYTILFSNLFIMLFIIKKKARRDIYHRWPKYRTKFHYFLLNETFDQIGSFATKYALSVLPVVVTTGIASVQPIFVLISCMIFQKVWGKKVKENTCKEHLIKKIFCFFMIIIGTILTVWD